MWSFCISKLLEPGACESQSSGSLEYMEPLHAWSLEPGAIMEHLYGWSLEPGALWSLCTAWSLEPGAFA